MKRYLNKYEVADKTGSSVRTVERWIADRKIRSFKTASGSVRFKESDVVEFIEAEVRPSIQEKSEEIIEA